MAYLITKAGSGKKQTGFITRGHADYPPDKGGKSYHFRDCSVVQAGGGPYGTRYSCTRLDPSEIWIPDGQRSPYPAGDDPTVNCRQTVATTYRQWGGRRKAGHKSVCAYGMVHAEPSSREAGAAKAACMALAEGQQLRDQPQGMVFRHSDARNPAAGSPADRYMAYPTSPRHDNLGLRCYFKEPLPSKETPFQQSRSDTLIASGHRFITEAEIEQYNSLCQPYMSPSGIEIPRKPVWKRAGDYFPSNPAYAKTDIADGDHELRCHPDMSGISIVIDPTLSRLNQQEAHAISAVLTAEEEAEKERQNQEMQDFLDQGEEQEHPWYVRYRIPLMLLGGMVVLGGGAALVQRMTARRRAIKANPDAYRYPIDAWPADYRSGVMDAWDDNKKNGPQHCHDRWNQLRGPLEGTFSQNYVDGYHDGFDASLGMSIAVEEHKTSKKNPEVSTELQLDRDGEVEYERIYVGPEDVKIMVGRVYRAPNHPLGWKAFTKMGMTPRYGRKQELLQWLVGRHQRRHRG